MSGGWNDTRAPGVISGGWNDTLAPGLYREVGMIPWHRGYNIWLLLVTPAPGTWAFAPTLPRNFCHHFSISYWIRDIRANYKYPTHFSSQYVQDFCH